MKLKYGPYSPSRLETATCGFAFKAQYIDKKIKRIPTVPQDRGSAVHEVFEKITAKMLQDPNYSFSKKEIQDWAAEAINRNPAGYSEVGPILDMAATYINRPPKVLAKDAEIELKLAVKLTDKGFVECGYDDPDAFARGRADILMISDDVTYALVYDHKTQPNVEDADTFQMGFYAWVISKVYPYLEKIKTVLHFARYGIYSEAYEWSKEDLAKIEDEVMTRVSIIESRTEWVAVPYKNCQYCPIISECPIMREYVELDAAGNVSHVKANNFHILGDTNKAVRAAGLINVLEEAIGILKGELREFVKDTGAIAIPGKIFEYRGTESINWDVVNNRMRAEVYAVFEKHGVDPKAFMSFNQTASKSVWLTENESLVKELSNMFPRTVATKFAGYKA